MSGTVRRSTRSRRPAQTIYDEARTARDSLDSTESSRSSKKRKKDDDDDEIEEVVEKVEDEASSSEENSDDEEEEDEEEDYKASTTKRKRLSNSPKAVKKPRKIEIIRKPATAGGSKSGLKKDKTSGSSSETGPTKRAVHGALTVLAKRVLSDNETPENSLLAALLKSHQEEKDEVTGSRSRRRAQDETLYTAQLKKIARAVMESHQKSPNRTQVDLFNLIFRSVGSTKETMLDPEQVDLENISDEELGEALTLVVEDMEYTAHDSVLLCADPRGDVHRASEGSKTSLGQCEYRKIFEEFWYQLGSVILADGSLSRPAEQSGDNDDSDSDEEEPKELSSSKFQVEMVREIVSRMIDLVNVGVTDIRAASTIAVYRLGIAMLERTVELKSKLQVATRQMNAAKRSNQKRKVEALKTQIDSWKRTVLDLEDTVNRMVMGVFMKRYKDISEFIRAESMNTLSRFTLIRPDIYLKDAYLKYVGWMAHDGEATVRVCALKALLAPFRASATAKKSQENIPIDTSAMSNVIEKFQGRLCDCVTDVDARVQEIAMELFVVLLREGFLDNLADDDTWSKINLRAIQPDASFSVRCNALLFVLDQLDTFDSGPAKTEDAAVAQINSLVEWISHNIGEFDIPIKQARYELTDNVVASLRAIPEHRALASNWSAMVRAIESELSGSAVDEDMLSAAADRRMEALRQRVLLRFLVCAAEMEVSSLSGEANENIDKDLVEARKAQREIVSASKKKQKSSSSHEDLTLALLGALPRLLESFKSEDAVMQILTSLPQYFLPNVFNLSSRKKDFQSLLKKLSGVFLGSVDNVVIQNCAQALSSLAKGDHSRTKDAESCIQKTVQDLENRLIELLDSKKALMGQESTEDNVSLVETTENSIRLCLTRLSALSKRLNLATCLAHKTDSKAQDRAVEKLFTTVAEYVAKELALRQIPDEEEKDGDKTAENHVIWKNPSKQIHKIVANSVSEAFTFLLCTTAWLVKEVVGQVDSSNKHEADKLKGNIVVRMRDHLVKLICACFELYLEPTDTDSYSEEQIAFSIAVQKYAGRTSGDLRSLLPKQWASSSSPTLSNMALVDDSAMIGGFVRFLLSQEEELRKSEEQDDGSSQAVRDLLLPIARSVTANWKVGNRREAGAALAHIVGSGSEATRLLANTSRILKKLEPVRLLEAHMACLRQDFDSWLDAEPEELESDRPTEEELAAYEDAEKAHKAKFEMLEHQAARLSASLGVGKLSDKIGCRVLFGFVREGVRFAFSTDDPGFDEDLPVGSRLAFLRILSKYLSWIRRDKESKKAIAEEFNQKEAELRNNPEFEQVFEDDKEALNIFRKAGDLGAFLVEDEDESVESAGEHSASDLAERPSTTSKRNRLSMGSSISSIRSKTSAQGSLSPLREEDEEEEDSPSPTKRRRMSQASENFSVSTAGQAQETIDEETDDGSDTD